MFRTASARLGGLTTSVFLMFALAAGPAVAQVEPGPSSIRPNNLRLHSESAALQTSLVGTLLPVGMGIAIAASGDNDAGGAAGVLMFAGLVAGPSLGYWTGGQGGHGWGGLGIRSLLLVGSATAAFAVCDMSCSSGSSDAAGAAVIALVGSTAALVHGIVDIAKVRGRVREGNQRRMSQVAVGPTVAPFTGDPGIGVRIAW